MEINTAYIRIALRYIIGAGLFGSGQIGEQLAADPDLVLTISALAGLAVEGVYLAAKRWGWEL